MSVVTVSCAMPWPQNQSLTAADGATFLALIEETPEGLWRASATVRLDKGYEILDQSLGIEMFPTLKDAPGMGEQGRCQSRVQKSRGQNYSTSYNGNLNAERP